MHFRTHIKDEIRGQAGRWQSEYHDAMVEHDKRIGSLPVVRGGQLIGIVTERGVSEASARDTWVAGYPLLVPMLDVHTIGAGGGSIAWVDDGGMLHVGPQSAGAVPGPVCYGTGGTEPTTESTTGGSPSSSWGPSLKRKVESPSMVTTGRPEPMMLSHQPRRDSSPWCPAAWASPVSAWQTTTTLSRSADSRP